jgi:hypothetical protein
MTTQIQVVEDYGRNSAKRLFVHETESPNRKAVFACRIIERWALVAAKVDGEDSAGRAKLGVLPPAEIVKHACDTAQLAFAEFEKRGWMLQMPDISDLLRKTDD